MKVLAFMTQKGGAGKTTLAASVAVAAQEAGERVYLIDLDPQGSLASWGDRREATDPPVDRIAPDRLEAALRGLAQAGYSLAVIDTQGVDSPAVSAAMRAADLALIPSRPSALDIEGAKPTISALARLGTTFAVVLNQCPGARTSRMQDAARALSLLGALAQPFMVQRADHMDAIALGLGATEYDSTSKAAGEIRDLWVWIRRKLERTGEGKPYGEATAVA